MHPNIVVVIPKMNRCLVGEPFDRFRNVAHGLCLTRTDVAEFVEVWITNDEMSSAEIAVLQSFEDRRL